MTRVLLLCPEPLGHRQPAGGGIRFVEFSRALVAAGHEVTVLSADGGEVANSRTAALSPQTIHDESVRADVAIAQGHVVNDFLAHAHRIPLVVDLYDPFVVENLHYYAARGAEVFNHDHATLQRSLLEGDFFLCASEPQRLFYLGAMLLAGRVNPLSFERDPELRQLIRVVPFGVQSPKALPKKDLTKPAILFGGIYDWYDPILAVDSVSALRRDFPDATLTFVTHSNADRTPQDLAGKTRSYVNGKNLGFVSFEEWVPYDERAVFYDRFTLALLTFPRSLETDLSMRTRVLDYLWAGLPIVTSSARTTDDLIERYTAGRVVTSEKASDFAAAMASLLDADAYRRVIEGTTQFAVDHQWSRSLEPLLEFCASPYHDGHKNAFRVEQSGVARKLSLSDRLKRKLRSLK